MAMKNMLLKREDAAAEGVNFTLDDRIVAKPEEKMKAIRGALARLKREDAAEGINFTLDERIVTIAALEVAHEIVNAVIFAKKNPAA
jgi:hypothetical protein